MEPPYYNFNQNPPSGISKSYRNLLLFAPSLFIIHKETISTTYLSSEWGGWWLRCDMANNVILHVKSWTGLTFSDRLTIGYNPWKPTPKYLRRTEHNQSERPAFWRSRHFWRPFPAFDSERGARVLSFQAREMGLATFAVTQWGFFNRSANPFLSISFTWHRRQLRTCAATFVARLESVYSIYLFLVTT
jgi:hypothetical protein